MLPGVAYYSAIWEIISATKSKRLLGFYRKYITFKSKEWINLRVKMSLSFSWILLLKNCHKTVGEKF